MICKVSGEGDDDAEAVKKISECQTKAGNQECFEKLEKLKILKT